jgi:hypothetical protein
MLMYYYFEAPIYPRQIWQVILFEFFSMLSNLKSNRTNEYRDYKLTDDS